MSLIQREKTNCLTEKVSLEINTQPEEIINFNPILMCMSGLLQLNTVNCYAFLFQDFHLLVACWIEDVQKYIFFRNLEWDWFSTGILPKYNFFIPPHLYPNDMIATKYQA